MVIADPTIQEISIAVNAALEIVVSGSSVKLTKKEIAVRKKIVVTASAEQQSEAAERISKDVLAGPTIHLVVVDPELGLAAVKVVEVNFHDVTPHQRPASDARLCWRWVAFCSQCAAAPLRRSKHAEHHR